MELKLPQTQDKLVRSIPGLHTDRLIRRNILVSVIVLLFKAEFSNVRM